ncbi:nuclease-related domain-containing protein [Congregicoccus parvus]|uniref:nuclease-related domain-containing protein n=1 Tax=Congregicoccus parvus TaxID=3081749 RepID=UPI003FA5E20C
MVWFLAKTAPQTRLDVGLALAGTITVALLVVTGAWILRSLRNIGNHCLGYFGERVVAEALEPLLSRGYRVFHDVPMEGRNWRANIDHVVVGPTGIVVVETKAIRKRRGLPGRKEQVLDCSGPLLRWPWGDGRVGLEQSVRNAEWLRKWIRERLAANVPVSSVLTFPGWYIEPPDNRHSIIPTTWLADRIPRLGESKLSEEQIDLIARQLDSLCRDVED